MADVFLSVADLRGETLYPDSCIICGKRKTKIRKVRLVHSTASHAAIAFGSEATIRSYVGRVPLCREHREYFKSFASLQLWIGLGGGCGGALLGFVLLGAAMAAPMQARGAAAIPGGIILSIALIGIPLLITFLGLGRVRASKFTDQGIWVTNASEDFRLDLEDLRESQSELNESDDDLKSPANRKKPRE